MNFDPGPYIAYYNAKNEEERRAILARAEEALKEARRLAREIRHTDPEVRAVILFGSLAEEGPQRLDFDIDLALMGGDVDKAMNVVDKSAFDVDVVDFDLLPEHIRARIRAKGIPLLRQGPPHPSRRPPPR
jgi:predicted nucleotidyltransferase